MNSFSIVLFFLGCVLACVLEYYFSIERRKKTKRLSIIIICVAIVIWIVTGLMSDVDVFLGAVGLLIASFFASLFNVFEKR